MAGAVPMAQEDQAGLDAPPKLSNTKATAMAIGAPLERIVDGG